MGETGDNWVRWLSLGAMRLALHLARRIDISGYCSTQLFNNAAWRSAWPLSLLPVGEQFWHWFVMRMAKTTFVTHLIFLLTRRFPQRTGGSVLDRVSCARRVWNLATLNDAPASHE